MNNNNFEALKHQTSLHEYCESNLEKKGRSFICPACESGKGPNGTPAFSIKPNDKEWHCFSCGKGGDIFDLAGIVNNLDSKAEQLEAVSRFAGVALDETSSFKGKEPKKALEPASIHDERRSAQLRKEHNESLEAFKKQSETACHAYIKKRGIDAERFGLCASKDNPKRLLIPYPGTDYFYYIVRNIEPAEGQNKYEKPKGVREPIFNESALDNLDYLIICEGQLDALTYIQNGFNATCLGSTGNNTLINKLIARKYPGNIILNLDNDEAGRKAQEDIKEQLKSAGLSVSSFTFKGATKDANEYFTAHSDFKSFVKDEIKAQIEAQSKIELDNLRVVDPLSACDSIFWLSDSEKAESTGLKKLDAALNGGLRTGVYVLAATSSYGKTSLALQIADYIASQGRKVLYVAIEQGARELTSKSLSRTMSQLDSSTEGLVPSYELTDKERREVWTKKRTQLLTDALNKYVSTIAPNLLFLEGTKPRAAGGVGQPKVEEIIKAAEIIKATNHQSPVIFIDYLQLIAANSEFDSDKQAADKNIVRLRQEALRLKCPVFVLSSVNRSSYSGVLKLESLKESGGIEYSSDVVLTLQPFHVSENMETKDKRTEQARKDYFNKCDKVLRDSNPRNLEISILKNRTGRTPREGLSIDFYPISSAFVEPVQYQKLLIN